MKPQKSSDRTPIVHAARRPALPSCKQKGCRMHPALLRRTSVSDCWKKQDDILTGLRITILFFVQEIVWVTS
ncbi:Hypothetical protein SMAX5B_007283 [Scophthalmus maximus]|uniref:Uncharacterized protein n=1 Tax=Scophthalmus maximus TaxID=52904 RepID=A0A2U9BQT7_SCOMX|nr:Hypothetical protein SMAX5B_007283 [Scophthalmus maximus]